VNQPGDVTQALTIRLPVDLYEQLRQEAFDRRTTMNALIMDALRKQLAVPRQASP
jgi:hypothetical protein